MFSLTNGISAIDFSNVVIKAPSEDEFVYMKPKNVHMINVQIICDSKNGSDKFRLQ